MEVYFLILGRFTCVFFCTVWYAWSHITIKRLNVNVRNICRIAKEGKKTRPYQFPGTSCRRFPPRRSVLRGHFITAGQSCSPLPCSTTFHCLKPTQAGGNILRMPSWLKIWSIRMAKFILSWVIVHPSIPGSGQLSGWARGETIPTVAD